jgi:hypothetical protein
MNLRRTESLIILTLSINGYNTYFHLFRYLKYYFSGRTQQLIKACKNLCSA